MPVCDSITNLDETGQPCVPVIAPAPVLEEPSSLPIVGGRRKSTKRKGGSRQKKSAKRKGGSRRRKSTKK